MNHEQQLGEHEARLTNLEAATELARRELREDLGKIASKLDEIAAWQAAHHDVATLHARVASLEATRDKVVGGWKGIAVVAGVAASCGALVGWVLDHAKVLVNKL